MHCKAFVRALRHAATLLCLLMSQLASSPMAQAMTMTPMQMELVPIGNRSHVQFQVTNNSAAPLPIEITYDYLSYTENGHRVLAKARDELVVFPITAMIPPGGTQTFRVQWVGSPDITTSQSFLVTARQLPVRMKNDGRSKVQMVSAFGAILNVAPIAGSADLKLLSSAPATTKQGTPALSILVENPTNVHALISNAVLRLGSLTLNQETLRSTVGIGVVEPGKRRRFLVPLPSTAPGRAALEYRPPNP